jgi:hypothetical protein
LPFTVKGVALIAFGAATVLPDLTWSNALVGTELTFVTSDAGAAVSDELDVPPDEKAATAATPIATTTIAMTQKPRLELTRRTRLPPLYFDRAADGLGLARGVVRVVLIDAPILGSPAQRATSS